MQLTANFTLAELEYSAKAEALGISNRAPHDHQLALRALATHVAQPIRDHVGPMRVSSGYRSAALNAATPNASKTSQHLRGEALDFVPLRMNMLEVFNWIIQSNIPFDQIIAEHFTKSGKPNAHGMWIHISHSLHGPQRRKITSCVKRTVKGKLIDVYVDGLVFES